MISARVVHEAADQLDRDVEDLILPLPRVDIDPDRPDVDGELLEPVGAQDAVACKAHVAAMAP